jgi:hypothetical protein
MSDDYADDYRDPDGLAYTLEVARGTKSSRMSQNIAAEEIWRAINAGTADDATTLCWAKFVAKQICERVIDGEDDRSRGMHALLSVGLWATKDRYRALRATIHDRLDMWECAKVNAPLKVTMAMVRQFRRGGLIRPPEPPAAHETPAARKAREARQDRSDAKVVKRQWKAVLEERRECQNTPAEPGH